MLVNKKDIINAVNNITEESFELDKLIEVLPKLDEVETAESVFSKISNALIFGENSSSSAKYFTVAMLIAIIKTTHPEDTTLSLLGENNRQDVSFVTLTLSEIYTATEEYDTEIRKTLGIGVLVNEAVDKQIELLLRILIILALADFSKEKLLYTLIRPMRALDNFNESNLEKAITKFRGEAVYSILIMLRMRFLSRPSHSELFNRIAEDIGFIVETFPSRDATVKELLK